MPTLLEHRSEWDESYLRLKCGTKLYRMVFGDKQAMTKFTRQCPGEKHDPLEQVIDLRVVLGDLIYDFPIEFQFQAIQRLTYDQVRRLSLRSLIQLPT